MFESILFLSLLSKVCHFYLIVRVVLIPNGTFFGTLWRRVGRVCSSHGSCFGETWSNQIISG